MATKTEKEASTAKESVRTRLSIEKRTLAILEAKAKESGQSDGDYITTAVDLLQSVEAGAAARGISAAEHIANALRLQELVSFMAKAHGIPEDEVVAYATAAFKQNAILMDGLQRALEAWADYKRDGDRVHGIQLFLTDTIVELNDRITRLQQRLDEIEGEGRGNRSATPAANPEAVAAALYAQDDSQRPGKLDLTALNRRRFRRPALGGAGD